MGRGEEALESIGAALDVVRALGDNAMLVSQAHRCTALLHLGRLDEAIEAADVAYAMVSRIPSIIWEKYRGLSAPAEVYLEALLRMRDRDEEMRRAVQVLWKRLDGVSRRMPVARPVALRLQGLMEIVDGNVRQGEKLLRKSIAATVRLALPIDEGIGEYELVRHIALSAGEKRAHAGRARAIFQRIGCDLYLRKLDLLEGA
jgi:hypothetical protein